MPINALLVLATAVGVGLAAGAATLLIVQEIRSKTRKLVIRKGEFFDWIEKLEQYAPKSLHLPRWVWLLGLLIFIVLFVLLKNPVPAVFGALLCVLIPDQLAYQKRKNYRTAVLEQLAAAIRLFTAEYAVAPQIDRCLAVVGQKIPPPVGEIFRRAYVDLIYGKPPDSVFQQLAKDLDSPHGHMFVQLLRSAQTQGQKIAPLFHDLVSRITVAQELEKQNKGEISGERAVGLLLAFLPLPLYLGLQRWIPEVGMFLTGTAAGRFIVFMCFFSSITWFFVDRLVSSA